MLKLMFNDKSGGHTPWILVQLWAFLPLCLSYAVWAPVSSVRRDLQHYLVPVIHDPLVFPRSSYSRHDGQGGGK